MIRHLSGLQKSSRYTKSNVGSETIVHCISIQLLTVTAFKDEISKPSDKKKKDISAALIVNLPHNSDDLFTSLSLHYSNKII